MLPGVIGVLQATEALKVLVGGGETLVGRLLMYDAMAMRFREMKFDRDPECAVCGVRPTIRDLSSHREDAAVACDAVVSRPPELPG